MFKLNQKVTIKAGAWKKFLADGGYPENYSNIGTQVITKILPYYVGTKRTYYLLTFPFIWWCEDDLEAVEEAVREQVDAIKIKNRTVHVGEEKMKELEKLQQRVKELEAICLTDEENQILYDYQHDGIECQNADKWAKIMQKLMNFSVAKPYK